MVQRILPLIRGIRVLKNWKRCMDDPYMVIALQQCDIQPVSSTRPDL